MGKQTSSVGGINSKAQPMSSVESGRKKEAKTIDIYKNGYILLYYTLQFDVFSGTFYSRNRQELVEKTANYTKVGIKEIHISNTSPCM